MGLTGSGTRATKYKRMNTIIPFPRVKRKTASATAAHSVGILLDSGVRRGTIRTRSKGPRWGPARIRPTTAGTAQSARYRDRLRTAQVRAAKSRNLNPSSAKRARAMTYSCPSCKADLTAHLGDAAYFGRCPKCGITLDKQTAASAQASEQTGMGCGIGFLCAIAGGALVEYVGFRNNAVPVGLAVGVVATLISWAVSNWSNRS
jgi:hypothetical protein